MADVVDRCLAMLAREVGCSPDLLQDERGRERVAVIAAIFFPSVREILGDGEGIKAESFLRRAVNNVNPVGGLLSECPLGDDRRNRQAERKFIADWQARGLKAALERVKPNPILLHRGSFLLQNLVAYCGRKGIDGRTVMPQQVFSRITPLRYILHSKERRSGALYQDLRRGMPRVKQRLIPPKGFRFADPKPKNTSGTLEEHLRKAHAPEGRVRQAAALLEQAEVVDFNAAFDSLGEAGAGMRVPEALQRGHRGRCAADARFYPSAAPPMRGLGAAEIENIVEASSAMARTRKGFWCEAAVVGVSTMAFCPPDALHELRVVGPTLVESQVSHPVETMPDPMLHEQTSPNFRRPLASHLIQALQDALKTGIPRVEAIDAFLGGVSPGATIAKVLAAIEHLAPTVWRFPEILPMTGLHPTMDRVPALREYILLDAGFWQQAREWYEAFDPGFAVPYDMGPGCGSPFVPRIDEIRAFVAELRALAEEVDSVEALDALAAGAFLFGCHLCGGLRLYPGRLASSRLEEDSISILYQKGVVVVPPNRVLREWARLYSRARARLIARGVLKISMVQAKCWAFALYRNEKPYEMSARAISEALLRYPTTRRWGFFQPGSFRHLTMTLLYRSGQFHGHDIEAFHGRSLATLHPLAMHRLEDPISRSVRDRIVDFLAAALGL